MKNFQKSKQLKIKLSYITKIPNVHKLTYINYLPKGRAGKTSEHFLSG